MTGARQRELSDRERAILELVGQFRIVNGGQIQACCFPNGSVIGARRRTQAVLKRLVDDHYLIRLDRRVGGVRAGSSSYCYSLATRGQRLLDPPSPPRRSHEPGLSFVRHHLAVADVYVALRQDERHGDLELLEYQTEPDCWRLLPKPFGGTDWVKPDLFVAVGVGECETRSFVEVDLATESLRRVERTCQRYVAYYRSGIEQADHDVFPRVVWLTPSQRRAAAIAEVITRLPIDDRTIFAVSQTTDSTQLLKGGDHAEPA